MRGDQSLKEPGDRPPGSVPHGWARTVAAAEPQVGFDKTGQAPRAQGQAGRGAAGMGVGPAPGAVALSRSRCPHTCWVDTRVLPPGPGTGTAGAPVLGTSRAPCHTVYTQWVPVSLAYTQRWHLKHARGSAFSEGIWFDRRGNTTCDSRQGSRMGEKQEFRCGLPAVVTAHLQMKTQIQSMGHSGITGRGTNDLSTKKVRFLDLRPKHVIKKHRQSICICFVVSLFAHHSSELLQGVKYGLWWCEPGPLSRTPASLPRSRQGACSTKGGQSRVPAGHMLTSCRAGNAQAL